MRTKPAATSSMLYRLPSSISALIVSVRAWNLRIEAWTSRLSSAFGPKIRGNSLGIKRPKTALASVTAN